MSLKLEDIKGPWINTATNITINGNMLNCELQTNDGNWVPRSLYIFTKYNYNNNNGNFEWDNFRNGVTKYDSYTHNDICRRYKKISVEECLNNYNNDYDDWFEIEESHVNCEQDTCVSISLFRYPHSNIEEWENKYLKSLIKNLDNWKCCYANVDMFLANNLKVYAPLFLKYKFLNIYVMKMSSNDSQPGMLWRFMNISNKKYKEVFVCDIDEPWSWIKDNKWKDSKSRITTLKPSDSTGKNLIGPWSNYATIIGSHIKIIPKKFDFDFDIVKVIKGFITICNNRYKLNNGYRNLFDDNDQVTIWNQPLDNNGLGWGMRIESYGFDEFFLKHVMYHYSFMDITFL